MKIVYMAHPVSGDVKNNLARAKAWVRWIEENHPDVAVVASWITECEIWDDDNPTHQAAGLKRDLAVIERCDELWLVGPKISSGMERERAHAEEHGLAIRVIAPGQLWPPGYVVHRAKPVAVVGYVREGDRILVRMRAGENDPIAGAYECPGGMVHTGESLLDALAREVREESGLTVEDARLLEVFDSPRAVVFLYRIAVSGEPRTEPGKEPWQWLTQNEAVEHSVSVPSALMSWLGKNQGLKRLGGGVEFERRYPKPSAVCLAHEPGFEPLLDELADPAGRRNVWIRENTGDVELCAGREGDDAYVRLRLLSGRASDLAGIVEIAHWLGQEEK